MNGTRIPETPHTPDEDDWRANEPDERETVHVVLHRAEDSQQVGEVFALRENAERADGPDTEIVTRTVPDLPKVVPNRRG